MSKSEFPQDKKIRLTLTAETAAGSAPRLSPSHLAEVVQRMINDMLAPAFALLGFDGIALTCNIVDASSVAAEVAEVTAKQAADLHSELDAFVRDNDITESK
jgi:uncharacterized protein YbjT (DUF2867 family)